ncbi:MAG TPA: hypothetical protein VFJ06_00725 [Halococcus sp.]|nr:hypothetical protein [Halococcus sp.]
MRVEFTQLVSIVEVPASLTVSAILAYLYFRQADLMDGQQKLMELDYTPKLSLGEVNITEERTVDGNTKGTNKFNLDLEESNSFPVEKLSIPLKNIGEGVATELQLDLNIIPIEPDSKQTRRYSALQRPLELQDRHKYGYISTGTMSFPIAEHHHNHLTSGTHEDFVATVTFRFDSDQEETGFVFLPFSLILELLKNQKVERARLQIGVDYSDTAQSEYTLSIVTIDFELENTNTLCDVLENGKIIYPTDLDEKMTGDYTPTISEVNSWTSSEPSKNS